jgi:hypothetical protein
MLELQQEKYEVVQEQVEGTVPRPKGTGSLERCSGGVKVLTNPKDKKLDNMSRL